ncbi:unnamed protein product [Rotaria sp. Silwood1]|nr:unnamed protein product [Rotaria sp. Silwood1]
MTLPISKVFLQSQQPRNMTDYYHEICNETDSLIYIQGANVKLHGSAIYWSCTLVPAFDRESIAQAENYAETDLHRAYSRILLFTCPFYNQEQKLLNFFQRQNIIFQRELSSIEHKLFKLVSYRGQVEQCQFVSSFTQFIHNMNTRFYYDKYVTPATF